MSGGLAGRTQVVAAAALAVVAAGVPQWAAAQDDGTMAPEEGMTQPDESATPPGDVGTQPDGAYEPDSTMQPEDTTTQPDQTGMQPEDAELPPDMMAPPDMEQEEMAETQPTTEEGEVAGFRAAVSAGGGVSDFAKPGARDFVNTGGNWDLRGIFGTRSIVGVEAAYIGNAYEIVAPGDSTTLFGNGVEISGRLNILRNNIDRRETGLQPYALAGVAWKNYQLSGNLDTAAVDDEDNSYEIPLGAGVSYYFENGILLDGRFAYRFSFDDDLIQPAGEDEARLDNWNATARLGFEF